MEADLFERHILSSQRRKGFRAAHDEQWLDLVMGFCAASEDNRLAFANILQRSVQVKFGKLVNPEKVGDLDKHRVIDTKKNQQHTVITVGDGLEEISASYFHIFSQVDLDENIYVSHDFYVSDHEDFKPGRQVASLNPNYNRYNKLGGIWLRAVDYSEAVSGEELAHLYDLDENLTRFMVEANVPFPPGSAKPVYPSGATHFQ